MISVTQSGRAGSSTYVTNFGSSPAPNTIEAAESQLMEHVTTQSRFNQVRDGVHYDVKHWSVEASEGQRPYES